MSNLGAWDVTAGQTPTKLVPETGVSEKQIETWIYEDPTMLGNDVYWVSRQLYLSDGTCLDLLGLMHERTWVVAELKAGPPKADAVRQALHYVMVIASMTTADLITRIEANPWFNPGVAERLEHVRNVGEDARDYRIIVAGVGDGSGAERASRWFSDHGFDVPIDVVTFNLFTNSSGGQTLVRRIEEEVATDEAAGTTYSLERLLDLADDFGVLADFEKIRAAILQRGYRSRQCKNSINFNLSSRLQLLYIAPAQNGIHVGYLTSNFPRLFGVSEESAKDELGANWLTLEGSEALAKVTAWMDAIDVMKRRAIAEA